VPAAMSGQVVTVQIYDGTMNPTSTGTGDGYGANSNKVPYTTDYTMYKATGSDADLNTSSGNTMLTTNSCNTVSGASKGTAAIPSGTNAAYDNAWYTICQFTVPAMTGSDLIYPLIVSDGSDGTGSNSYSLRACVLTAGTCPSSTAATLYAINTMSIYTPDNGSGTSNSKFYLADIGKQYEGHTLEIDMFDPGDAGCKSGNSCSATISVLQPPSGLSNPPTSTLAANAIACSYTSRTAAKATTYPNTPDTNASPCSITSMNNGNDAYNGLWLTIDITIPSGSAYYCDNTSNTDCWWTVLYAFNNSTSTDRTTWSVGVLGNPVHLIH